jgi:hypothetical protein
MGTFLIVLLVLLCCDADLGWAVLVALIVYLLIG